MGGKKKTKSCSYIKPHPGHTWHENKDGQALDRAKKFFCLGIAQSKSNEHVHIWDRDMPVMKNEDSGTPYTLHSKYGDGPLWEGPCECACGQAAWLKDGRKKRDLRPKPNEVDRFPVGDPYVRMVALKAKIDSEGIDSLSEEDREEINAIATAVIEALQPLMEAFAQLAARAVEVIQDFLDSLDPEIVAELHRIAAVYAEPPEHRPDTIDLVGSDGVVIETRVIGFEPTAAATHVAAGIVEDALQPNLAPDPNDPVEIARKAIAEPFKEPFKLTLSGMSVPIVPGDIPEVTSTYAEQKALRDRWEAEKNPDGILYPGVDRMTSRRGPSGELLI